MSQVEEVTVERLLYSLTSGIETYQARQCSVLGISNTTVFAIMSIYLQIPQSLSTPKNSSRKWEKKEIQVKIQSVLKLKEGNHLKLKR